MGGVGGPSAGPMPESSPDTARYVMSCPAVDASGPYCPHPVIRPYTSRGLRANATSGPTPSRSATPGRNPSISASERSARRSTTSAAPGCRRSNAIERRPRPTAVLPMSRGSARSRSMRTTSAPRSASSIPRNGTGPTAGNSITRTPSRGPGISRSESLAVVGLLAQQWTGPEALPVPIGQLIGARHESRYAVSVDVLQHATGPGREADAHDGADVRVRHGGDDVLLQAPHRLDRLGEQQPLLQLLQVDVGGLAAHRELGRQAGPERDALTVLVVEEARTAQASRAAQLDHPVDNHLAGMCLVPLAGRGPCLVTDLGHQLHVQLVGELQRTYRISGLGGGLLDRRRVHALA